MWTTFGDDEEPDDESCAIWLEGNDSAEECTVELTVTDKGKSAQGTGLGFDTSLDMLKRVLAVAEIVAKSLPLAPASRPKSGQKSRTG